MAKTINISSSSYFLATLLLVSLSTLARTYAVTFVVQNRAAKLPGGIRFNKEIGAKFARGKMKNATNFIWRIFKENKASDRKKVPRVTLIIDDLTPQQAAFTINNKIHVGDDYINNYRGISKKKKKNSRGDLRREFRGVLVHEMTHIWQWDGNGQAVPSGLIEGIADYVRLKANYAPSYWAKPGQGDRWDQGYDVTARFLDYCDGLKSGFVAKLNKKMRNGYSNNFFVELLGKNVDQLWRDYKAKFKGN